jgi:uncharacterized protein (TIGR02271 family)
LEKKTMAVKRAATTTKAASGNTTAANTDSSTESEKMVIPVIAEQIAVGKEIVETGKVRISKRISEHEELVDVPLFREEVRVERVPINLFVETLPLARQEGDTMIIPVVEEQIVIQKKLMLVEEIRVRREVVEHHQPQTVNVRKEEVDIKRVAKNRKTGGSGTNR